MNEPHNIPDMAVWAGTVQAAVTAIRQAGATTQLILLPGNDFTGAQTFVNNGSAGNLSTVHNLDGTNTSLIFDVHKYLDSDGSGTHTGCVSNHITDAFMPLALHARRRFVSHVLHCWHNPSRATSGEKSGSCGNAAYMAE
jgi:endoglucanase